MKIEIYSFPSAAAGEKVPAAAPNTAIFLWQRIIFFASSLTIYYYIKLIGGVEKQPVQRHGLRASQPAGTGMPVPRRNTAI
jgi:hypothetical protein